MRRAFAIALLACPTAFLFAFLVGCSEQEWQSGKGLRAPDEDVAAALGDTAHQNDASLSADDVPVIEYPRSLRPCCAFGVGLQVKVGMVPVPGVQLDNAIDPDEVGPHRYDNGFLTLNTQDPRGLVDNENNGLVYTCRGGFIDLAHVRDNADNTLGLTSAVARHLETGGRIELPPQGADLAVRVDPVPPEAIARHGRIRLATEMARWLAYELSIWHEIATWYGYASLAEWPEKISAFSPEDLYSNQLGVRLAAGIIRARRAGSDIDYGLSMDAWIERTLTRLEAVSAADTESAGQAVDGAWWTSERRIPDWDLVQRRQMDTGPLLRPWLLEDASPGSRGPVEPLSACRDAAPPLVLRVPDGFNGQRFSDHVGVEARVHDELAEQGFPFPRANSRLVTQRDFPAVIARIRAANAEALGPGADAP